MGENRTDAIWEALDSMEARQAEAERLRKQLRDIATFAEMGIKAEDIVGRRRIRIGQKKGVPFQLKRTMGYDETMEYENDWYRMGIWDSDCEIVMRDGTTHRVPASMFSWKGTLWEHCDD